MWAAEQAQRLDKAMREDLNKYDPHWGVHVRIKCMRSEEARAEQERQEAESPRGRSIWRPRGPRGFMETSTSPTTTAFSRRGRSFRSATSNRRE